MNQKSALNKTILIAWIFVFILIGSSAITVADAASVTLAWNATSPTPDGYRLFVRRNDQLYDFSRPAWQGSTLLATIDNLQEQTEYYFVVRAFDGTRESGNSNEVRYVIAALENNSPTPPNSTGSDTTPPYWDGATSGIGSVMAESSGGQVTIEFDTARDAEDGRNLKFNVYYSPSSSWENGNWTGNSVVAQATLRQGETFAHAVTVNGLTNGVSYTFGVRVEDQSGNEDTNTGTLRATPASSGSIVTTEDTIIDNRSSQTSQTGSWEGSSGSNPYDRDSLWSRDGSSFTWHFTPSQSGVYEVGMWWTEWSSRNTRIPVNIAHAQGNATVYVNQQVNGGRWNSQGQFQFQAGTTYRVTITAQPGPSSTCADAVRFRLLNEDNPVNVIQPGMSTIIDNRSSQTTQTGSWSVSDGSNPYDRDSLWSRNGSSFTWHFTPSQSGVYDVGMWWTQWSSRNTRVPVNIAHAQGNATVYVNQQVNGGRWNSQGQFQFQAGSTYRVTITAQPGPSSTCADAVRFQLVDAK